MLPLAGWGSALSAGETVVLKLAVDESLEVGEDAVSDGKPRLTLD